ncbi:MAG: transporter [Pseudomonadales bacterium]
MIRLFTRACQRATFCTLTALSFLVMPAVADVVSKKEASTNTVRPDSHAPIAVMGDHVHKKGEFMFSYRFMRMKMEGNRDGTSRLAPDNIAASVANRFANPPMQPPTLRVVPTEMTMDMHMLGMMYAPSDKVTLMLMTSYRRKEMEHITFMGPMGTNELGRFKTETSGLGDTSVSALIKLNKHWHATAGLSLPTGDIKETDTILTPMNTMPSPRLPYPMQLGSGSYDPIAGLSYADHSDSWGWGGQWRSTFRLWDNSEDYTLGDEHTLSAWASYRLNDSVSVSSRLQYAKRGNISGMDQAILAPVQTADPDRQAYDRLDGALGLNFVLPGSRHRLGLELAAPLHQDFDGPQLETDWTLTLGWQYAP